MQNYPFKSYDGARGNCLAIGVMARDEYLIDMAVGKIFSKFAKDDNGQPVDLRQFHIISGTDVQKEFTTLLDEMPNFIRRNVSDYKYGILKIEELWDKIRTYVTELITVFAHAVASYKGQIELLEKCANLTKYEAYELYLAEHLDAISLNWRNFYDEHRLDGEQDDDELWLEIYKIFMNCGLILANSPTRELYIHVPCFK